MTTTQHLATVINHWTDLTAALPAGGTGTAFGIGLTAYLDYLDRADQEEVAEYREARGWQRDGTLPLGERPVPIRLRVHDTMRGIERVLLELADQTAAVVQRPAISPAPGDWPYRDRQRRNLLAAAERDDPRRWSWTDPRTRTAVLAAVWLQHRLDGAPGPFTPLTAWHRDRITTTAAGAAQRVLAALDMTRRTQQAPFPCPACRGTLKLEGGDGHPPAIRCTEPHCGWTRTAHLEDAA